MIKNTKTVDPADPDSPEVIQIETAMGAAIEVFEGARTIEVGRDRFVPVKTTNDLLVLRSDCYELDDDARAASRCPTRSRSSTSSRRYKLVGDFERAVPRGVPSLRGGDAASTVQGDWTFGADVAGGRRGRGRRRRRRRARIEDGTGWTEAGRGRG